MRADNPATLFLNILFSNFLDKTKYTTYAGKTLANILLNNINYLFTKSYFSIYGD